MGIKKLTPTSPARRYQTYLTNDELTTDQPYKPLLESKKRTSGRNNLGKMTVRHRGGGHKRHYRLVDFKRSKTDIPAIVERLEYDPNRTANIALILFKDGERQYIIAPKGIEVGQEVISSETAPVKVGNCMPLRSMPVGTTVHCVELKPGKGAQIARSAGTSVQLVARDNVHATIRLRSGEMRKVMVDCKAVIGEVSNSEHNLASLGKAGSSRWRGIRPTVRGVVMNPVDHPHGGGEGRCPIGHPRPVSPWGKPALGKKTRRPKKYSDSAIARQLVSTNS